MDEHVDLSFPHAGIDRSVPFGDQRPRQMPSGEWGRTTPIGQNVRTHEPRGERGRGGNRPGLDRYIEQAVVENWILQDINSVTFTDG